MKSIKSQEVRRQAHKGMHRFAGSQTARGGGCSTETKEQNPPPRRAGKRKERRRRRYKKQTENDKTKRQNEKEAGNGERLEGKEKWSKKGKREMATLPRRHYANYLGLNVGGRIMTMMAIPTD